MFMVISGAISLPRDGWNAERLRAGPRPTIRVLIIVDSDDDGGDADAEYAELRAWAGATSAQSLASGNVSSRRRSAFVEREGGFEPQRVSASAKRHSMAV